MGGHQCIGLRFSAVAYLAEYAVFRLGRKRLRQRLIRGAGFWVLEHELDHMPLYYALSAIFMAVLGDAMLAAQSVSMMGGLIALGIAVDLLDRIFGRSVACCGLI